MVRPRRVLCVGVLAGAAGLGLSIAKRLAETQGGNVSYADRPGGGSVFTFELPAAAQELLETMP
jgi:signal transduction histidine kinase